MIGAAEAAPSTLPLGPVEEAFWRVEQQHAGLFRVLVVLWVCGRVDPALLAKALQRVQARHPKLRAAVTRGKDGRHRFDFTVPIAPIPFSIIDCEQPDLPWRDQSRRMMEADFADGAPLAAISVLRATDDERSVLILGVHHALADGAAALTIAHDVLVAYGQGVTNVNEPEAAALPVTPFRRAPQPSWRNRLWLLRRFIRLQRRLRRGHTSLPVRAGLPSRSQWTHWVFTDAQTLQLVRACRKQRTSLNALLIAVVCHALRDGLGERDAAFPCIVPFDIRRLFESGGESEIGSFIGVMSALVDVAEDGSLWDAARTAHEEIESFQAHDGPASVYNLAARMANAAFTRALPQVLDARRPALLATYYGVLPWADRYGNLTLGGATLDAGNQMAGPHLVIEGLVLGKKLNVGFSASGLEPSFWEELQRRVGEVLLCAGEGT